MLTAKQEQKLINLYENWLNGNIADTMKKVQSLTKKELYVICTADFYSDNEQNRQNFITFVGKSLSNSKYF